MISSTTQAVLLLTSHFHEKGQTPFKPLTPTEWERFYRWLKQHSIRPERFLYDKPQEILKDWQDSSITINRIEGLMNRGSAQAFSVEKWERNGLWIITVFDEDYPCLFKQRLGTRSPAVLFGCGNQKLLNAKALAVVGSRKASNEDLAFSDLLGRQIAMNGYAVVSGGARGIDQQAMLGALRAEGTCIGVLADSLLRASSSAVYREALLSRDLVLISPFNPEAGFNVGHAMQRNKYIYCLSKSAIVVHSGKSGGTWSGAFEALKFRWVPLWVKPSEDPEAGNSDLIKQGAKWLPKTVNEIDFSLFNQKSLHPSPVESNLFTSEGSVPKKETVNNVTPATTSMPTQEDGLVAISKDESIENINPINVQSTGGISFYEFFLEKVKNICGNSWRTKDELEKELDLCNTQLNAWLNQAVSEKKLKKKTRPVSYRWVEGESLFR